MVSDIFFENKKYISVKDASALTGYSKDYIGQLCRSEKVLSKRVGRVWYVEEESLLTYKNTPTTFDFAKNLYAKKDIKIVTETPVVNAVVVEEKFDTVTLPEVVAPVVSEVVIVTKNEVPKSEVFSSQNKTSKAHSLHEVLFAFDLNFSKRLVPVAVLVLVFLGGFSLRNSFADFSKTRNSVAEYSVDKNVSISGVTKVILDTPKFFYTAFADVMDLYSNNLKSVYGNVGNVMQGTRSQVAAVVESTSNLNPVDHSGIVVYRKINSWFEGLFAPASIIVNTNSIVKNDTPVKTQPIVVATNVPQTKVVNTTRVVERIIEKPVSGTVTTADLQTSLQQLNNEILSKLYSLSTGTGGNITNVYQQIAQSQRIDQLTNTVINNPTINGGTITSLTVTNTATSTFAGGISLSGGCVSVNGVCLGTGNGGYNLIQDEGVDLVARSTINFVGGGVTATDLAGVTTVTINGTSFTGAPNSIITTDSLGALTATGTQLTVGNLLATSTATSTFIGGISTNLLSVTSTTATSTFANGLNLTGGCFAINGSCVTGGGSALTFTYPLVNTLNTISLAFGTTTANTWANLQTFVFSSTTYGSFTTASTTNLVINGSSFNNLLGTGLSNVGGALTLDSTSLNVSINSFIAASTTIPKTYTANTFTALNTFSNTSTTLASFGYSSSTNANIGTLSLFSGLNGPLQVNGGVVSATTSIGTIYGGTGIAVAPTYGQVLVGNSSGGYTLTSTSSLGIISGGGTLTALGSGYSTTSDTAIAFSTTSTSFNGLTFGQTIVPSSGALTFTPSVSGTLTVNGGGTGAQSFTSGNLIYGSGTGALQSVGTSTPTVGASLSYSGTLGNLVGGVSGNLSLNLGNANSWTALQTFAFSSTTYGSFTTASTTNLTLGGQTFTSLLGSGLTNTGGALTLDSTFLNNSVNSFIAASTTIPKTYTANTFTALNTFSNTSTTLASFTYASTTSLFAGNITLSTTTAGLLRTDANGITFVDTTNYSTFAFPFTPNTGYNSTTTTLGLLNGFFSTASSTQSGNFFLPSLTQGFAYTGSNGQVQTVSTSTIASYILPFTSYGASTSTTLGLTGGLFSTASSTFSGPLRLPSLSQGVAYIGSTGLVGTTATTTVSCSGSTSCSSFVAFGSAPITITSTDSTASTTLLSDSNSWSGLNRFTNASSSIFSAYTAFFGGTATSTFDTTGRLTLAYSSSTAYSSFNTASTTNLTVGTATFSTTTAGFLKTNSSGLVYIDPSSGNAASSTLLSDTNFFSGRNSFANASSSLLSANYAQFGATGTTTIDSFGRITFPYSSSTAYSSFVNSSTTNASIGTLSLPSLSNGGLAVFGGVVSSGATTTAGTGLTYSGNAFNVNTTQNITALSNLTNNGVAYTSNGNGTLNTVATTSLSTNGSLSVTGTLGALLGGSASTLSLNLGNANSWTALQTFAFSSTTYGSFTTASTTNLTLGGQTFTSLLGSGLTNTGGALTLDSTFLNNSVNSFIAASTTIPKTYTANTFTALNTFSNTSTTLASFTYASTTSLFAGNITLSTTTAGLLRTDASGVTFVDTTNYQTAGNYLTTLGSGYASTTATAVTFSTTTSSFNGLTAGITVIPSSGALTLTPTLSGTLNNGGLTNSTISGIPLGSDLENLTATNGTLTFSGAYNGGTARTVGLNLNNPNSWTALQTFAFSSTTYGSFTTASTTNLVVGNYNGPLQANNGVVSATTSIGQLYGGTGITSYTAGDILYANSSGVLTKLPIGADALVLKVVAGLPSWQTDLTSGGGGGATAWSTTTNSMAIYPTDTSDILILGTNATSTTGNIFEVLGNSLFRGDVRITGNASSSLLSANQAWFGGTATSSFNNAGRLTLAGLSAGGLAVDNNGLVYSGATTTAGTGLTYSGNAFNVNTTQNITALSNLTNNGVAYTSNGNGTLNTVATTSLSTNGSLSVTGTLGALLGGSASTLSLNLGNANSWTALQTFAFSSTTYGSFTTASTTNLNSRWSNIHISTRFWSNKHRRSTYTRLYIPKQLS
jgi:hypothetical protein